MTDLTGSHVETTYGCFGTWIFVYKSNTPYTLFTDFFHARQAVRRKLMRLTCVRFHQSVFSMHSEPKTTSRKFGPTGNSASAIRQMDNY